MAGREQERLLPRGDQPDLRKTLGDRTGFPAQVVKSFELPSYDAAVRPQDVDRWLTAMRDVNGFKGQVDTKKLTFSP